MANIILVLMAAASAFFIAIQEPEEQKISIRFVVFIGICMVIVYFMDPRMQRSPVPTEVDLPRSHGLSSAAIQRMIDAEVDHNFPSNPFPAECE